LREKWKKENLTRGEKEEPKPTRPVPQCKECIKVVGKPVSDFGNIRNDKTGKIKTAGANKGWKNTQ
jgi:hypothetical protein